MPAATVAHTLCGPLVLVTPPSALPITLEQAKVQCRVDHADEDEAFAEWIAEATEEAECLVEGHRQLCTATYDLPLRDWWTCPLRLPRPPLQAVESIRYYDEDGSEATLPSTSYRVRQAWRQPGVIEWVSSAERPGIDSEREYPITIRFRAGYSDDGASVPLAAKSAVKLLVQARWQRDPMMPGGVDVYRRAAEDLMQSLGYGAYG